MNLSELLDSPFCVHLTLTLAHVLWQGLVIAALAAGASWCLRGASAQSRYLIHVTALLLMVVVCLPVTFAVVYATVSGPALQPAVMEDAPPADVAIAEPAIAPPADVIQPPVEFAELPAGSFEPSGNVIEPPLAPQPTETEPAEPEKEPVAAAQAGASIWQTLAPYASGAYIAGVLAMLARLWLALQGGYRLRRRSQPIDDPGLLAIVKEQARLLGMRFVPVVAYCERVAVPVVVGVLRPMILLPVSLTTGLTPDQLRAILAHELTHLRRYDHLVNILQRFVEAVLFFHPAAWYVSWRVNVEREHCCDDLVVATGHTRCDYAESLIRVAELSLLAQTSGRSYSCAALGASGGSGSRLRERVLRLIDGRSHERLRLWRTWPVAFVLIAAALVATSLLMNVRAEPTDRVPEAELADAEEEENSGQAVEPAFRGLVNERLVLKHDDKSYQIMLSPWTMRLGPKGKRLLYHRCQSGPAPGPNIMPPRPNTICRRVLRDLPGGKDTVLPTPAMEDGTNTALLMTMNPFDPSGEKLVLASGVDTNEDDIVTRFKEQMQLVLYDIGSRQMKRLDVSAHRVLPMFDRTGSGLIVMTDRIPSREGKGELFATPLLELAPKPFPEWGWPRNLCPTSDILPLVLAPSIGAWSGRSRSLAILDLKSGQTIAELPADQADSPFFYHNTHWTSNGRYLYYADLRRPRGPQTDEVVEVTRIWDRQAGKMVDTLDWVVPIGPGPTPTTMLLAQAKHEKKPKRNHDWSRWEDRRMILHDPSAGRTWPLGDDTMCPLTSNGKHVVYSKPLPDGKQAVFMAEIGVPLANKSASRPRLQGECEDLADFLEHFQPKIPNKWQLIDIVVEHEPINSADSPRRSLFWITLRHESVLICDGRPPKDKELMITSTLTSTEAEDLLQWRGRRIQIRGGGKDWPDFQDDILASFKAADDRTAKAEPTPLSEKLRDVAKLLEHLEPKIPDKLATRKIRGHLSLPREAHDTGSFFFEFSLRNAFRKLPEGQLDGVYFRIAGKDFQNNWSGPELIQWRNQRVLLPKLEYDGKDWPNWRKDLTEALKASETDKRRTTAPTKPPVSLKINVKPRQSADVPVVFYVKMTNTSDRMVGPFWSPAAFPALLTGPDGRTRRVSINDGPWIEDNRPLSPTPKHGQPFIPTLARRKSVDRFLRLTNYPVGETERDTSREPAPKYPRDLKPEHVYLAPGNYRLRLELPVLDKSTNEEVLSTAEAVFTVVEDAVLREVVRFEDLNLSPTQVATLREWLDRDDVRQWIEKQPSRPVDPAALAEFLKTRPIVFDKGSYGILTALIAPKRWKEAALRFEELDLTPAQVATLRAWLGRTDVRRWIEKQPSRPVDPAALAEFLKTLPIDFDKQEMGILTTLRTSAADSDDPQALPDSQAALKSEFEDIADFLEHFQPKIPEQWRVSWLLHRNIGPSRGTSRQGVLMRLCRPHWMDFLEKPGWNSTLLPQTTPEIELPQETTAIEPDAHVAIMSEGYKGKAPQTEEMGPARELAKWRGRRVFVWDNRTHWPGMEADIVAAFKAADKGSVAAKATPLSGLCRDVAALLGELEPRLPAKWDVYEVEPITFSFDQRLFRMAFVHQDKRELYGSSEGAYLDLDTWPVVPKSMARDGGNVPLATWRGRKIYLPRVGKSWPTHEKDILAALRASDADDGRATNPALHTGPWGESVGGLRMAARGKAGESMLWCVIRNHGSQPVRYSDYLLGYFESVSLLARPVGSTNWTKLPQRGHYVKSAGASSRNVHVLGAEENMPPPDNWPRPKATGMSYSFSVDFANFQWPETWRGDLEVVVVQALGNDGSKETWTGKLSSAPTIVSMDHTPNSPNSVPVFLRSLSAEDGEKPLDKGDGVAAKGSDRATSGDPRSVEQLIAALANKDEWIRLAAIRALGELGDRRAVQPLLVAMTHKGGLPAPPVVIPPRQSGIEGAFAGGLPIGGEDWRPPRYAERGAAATALAKLADPRAVKPLAEMLGESRSSPAILLMGSMGSDSAMRFSAARALARFGPTGFALLLATLRDEDSPGRAAAAYALGTMGDRRAVARLIATLGDKNGSLREQSAWALGELGAPKAFQPLRKAMGDEEKRVRAKATEALSKSGDARAVDLLIAALAGKDEYMWAPAARGLGHLGDPRAVGPLITALDYKYTGVTDAAAWDLVHLDVPQPIFTNYTGVRDDAARSLGMLKDPKAVEPIIKFLGHEYWRQSAAKALGELGDPRAVGPLKEALAKALKDEIKGGLFAKSARSEIEKALAKIAASNTKNGADPNPAKRLQKAIAAKLPKNWTMKPSLTGRVTPTHWPTGAGLHIRAERRGFVSADWKRIVDGKVLGGSVHVWIMGDGYSAKGPRDGESTAPPATEIERWHGRRVLIWGGGADWKDWEEDIQAAAEALKRIRPPKATTRPTTQPAAGRNTQKMNPPPNYTGKWTVWYTNGPKRSEAQYSNGTRHGASTSWHPDGQKHIEENYKKGRQHGTSTMWYSNGRRQYTIDWENGQKHGKQVSWYHNGWKEDERLFEKGKFIRAISVTGTLTPRKWGVQRAKEDIAKGRKRIYYYGKPWSAGKPLVDDRSGLPVEILAGCTVTKALTERVEAYNETMRASIIHLAVPATGLTTQPATPATAEMLCITDKWMLWRTHELVKATAGSRAQMFTIRAYLQRRGQKHVRLVTTLRDTRVRWKATVMDDGTVVLNFRSRLAWVPPEGKVNSTPGLYAKLDGLSVEPLGLYPDGVILRSMQPGEEPIRAWFVPFKSRGLATDKRIPLTGEKGFRFANAPGYNKIVRSGDEFAWSDDAGLHIVNIANGVRRRFPFAGGPVQAFDGKTAVSAQMSFDLKSGKSKRLEGYFSFVAVRNGIAYGIGGVEQAISAYGHPKSLRLLALDLDSGRQLTLAKWPNAKVCYIADSGPMGQAFINRVKWDYTPVLQAAEADGLMLWDGAAWRKFKWLTRIDPPATQPADGSTKAQEHAGAAGASVATLLAEAETLRKESPGQWAQWDQAVAGVLAKHAARVRGWGGHARPPAPDVAPLKLPMAYLVWHWRDASTAQRLAAAYELGAMYLRAIADSGDERRIDILLQVLGGSEWGGKLLVKAMTPERVEPSIRELLAGAPKLGRDAPLHVLLREFAAALSPEVRKASYDWLRSNWRRGPSNGDGEQYWETLFRLDLDRARGEVIGYYGQRYNRSNRYDLYVLNLLLAHGGPSEQVANAVRRWRNTPDEFLDFYRRRVLVCADPEGELEGYMADIEAQFKSGQRPDELPYLVRALVEHIPRQSVKYLRQFANDRRLTGLMGEGARKQIVWWLVEQQDDQAEKIVARWLAEEDQYAQRHLIDILARQGEFARGLLKKVRPGIELPPLPAEKASPTQPAKLDHQRMWERILAACADLGKDQPALAALRAGARSDHGNKELAAWKYESNVVIDWDRQPMACTRKDPQQPYYYVRMSIRPMHTGPSDVSADSPSIAWDGKSSQRSYGVKRLGVAIGITALSDDAEFVKAINAILDQEVSRALRRSAPPAAQPADGSRIELEIIESGEIFIGGHPTSLGPVEQAIEDKLGKGVKRVHVVVQTAAPEKVEPIRRMIARLNDALKRQGKDQEVVLKILPAAEYAVWKMRRGAAFGLANYATERPIFDNEAAQKNTPEEILMRPDKATRRLLFNLLDDRKPIPLRRSMSPHYVRYKYRVCDYAMFLLIEVLGEKPGLALSEDLKERDRRVAELKSKAEEVLRSIPRATPAGGDEVSWGKPVDGLRCGWVPPAGPVMAGSAPEVAMRVENVGKGPAVFGFTLAVGLSSPNYAGEGHLSTFLSPRVTCGPNARPATVREVRTTLQIETPQLKDDDPLDGYYHVKPGAQLTLRCRLPLDSPSSTERRIGPVEVNGILYRDCHPVFSDAKAVQEADKLRCPPLMLEVVEKDASGKGTEATDEHAPTLRQSVEHLISPGTYREVLHVEEPIVDTLGRTPFPAGLLVGSGDELTAVVLGNNRIIRRISAKESRCEVVGASNSGGLVAALARQQKDGRDTWRLSLLSRRRKATAEGRSWELSPLDNFDAPSATKVQVSDDGNTILLVDNWHRRSEGHDPAVRTLDRNGKLLGELKLGENGGYTNGWYLTSDGATLFVPESRLTPDGVRYGFVALDRNLDKSWSFDLKDADGVTFAVNERAKRLVVCGGDRPECWLLDFSGKMLFEFKSNCGFPRHPRMDGAGKTIVVSGGYGIELHEVGKSGPLWTKNPPTSPQGNVLRGYDVSSADISPDGRLVVASYHQWHAGGEGFRTAPRFVVVYDRAGKIVCQRTFDGKNYTTACGLKVAFTGDGRSIVVQEEKAIGLLQFAN